MTAAAILAALACLPCGYIGAEMAWLDRRRTWRMELDSEEWHSPGLVEVVDEQHEPGERLTSPEPLPAEADVVPPRPQRYAGRHRPGRRAAEKRAVRPAWDTPTEAFAALVSSTWTTAERRALVAAWLCGSCEVGRDGEQQHVSCTGCSCPCGVATEAAR